MRHKTLLLLQYKPKPVPVCTCIQLLILLHNFAGWMIHIVDPAVAVF